MTFEDLPDNIRDLSLADETLAADVVDLFVSVADRLDGCMGAMICDELGRGVQPVVVAADGEHLRPDDTSRFVDALSRALPDDYGLVLAVGRPGSGMPTDEDRAAHQGAIDTCRQLGIRLLGFFVATPDEVASLPAPLAESA